MKGKMKISLKLLLRELNNVDQNGLPNAQFLSLQEVRTNIHYPLIIIFDYLQESSKRQIYDRFDRGVYPPFLLAYETIYDDIIFRDCLKIFLENKGIFAKGLQDFTEWYAH